MRGVTMPGSPGRWPQELFVDPLTGEPIPGPGEPVAVASPTSRLDEPARPVVDDAGSEPHPVPGFDSEHPAPTDSVSPGAAADSAAPGDGRRPGHRRGAMLVVGLSVLTLLVVAALVGIGDQTGQSVVSALPTATSFPALPPPITQPRLPVAPTVQGWQGVGVAKYHVAYDVPPTWKVETPGTIVGYDDPQGQPLVVMGGVSTYKEGFCAGRRYSYRAHVGFTRSDRSDPVQAARQTVQDWADAGYSDKQAGGTAQLDLGRATAVRVGGGAITATEVTGRVTVQQPKDCDANSVAVTGVAMALPGGGLVVCVVEADQDVPDALPAADLAKIIATIRPLHP